MRVVIAVLVLLAGCADSSISYRASEPGPGAGGPYGGDGTVDMVVAYFSFEIDAEHAFGDMGAHCGFDDWTMDPATALVHTGGEGDPDQVVMRQIHPDQSTQNISHFGTAPQALWRQGHDIQHAFGTGDHGSVLFNGGVASFRGLAIPSDRWMLAESTYTHDHQDGVWTITETLHLRHFPDVPVDFDRGEKICM